MRRLTRFVKGLPLTLLLAFDVLLFYPLLCVLPYGWAFPIIRWRGNVHFRLMKGFRTVMLKDLAACLPERSETERGEISRKVFQMQAAFFYDTYMWTRYRVKSWSKRFSVIQGQEHLDDSLRKGQGVILCTMHFNNYFYPGGYLLARGYPVTPYAVRPWDMKKVNFFIKLHHAYLIWMSPKRVKVRYILAGRQQKGEIRQRLKENFVFYALLDIPLPEKQDLKPVSFLGETAMFPDSLVHLKYKSGAPFHVMYMFRDMEDWRRQTVVITPELSFRGNVEEDLQQAVSELEKAIRKYPHLWWGWGMVSRMRPEHIRKAQARKDYSTTIG